MAQSRASSQALDFLERTATISRAAEAELTLGRVFPLEQCDLSYPPVYEREQDVKRQLRDLRYGSRNQSDPRLMGGLLLEETSCMQASTSEDIGGYLTESKQALPRAVVVGMIAVGVGCVARAFARRK